MNVGCLNGPVNLLLVRRKLIEIRFGCGRQGFDDIFQGIFIYPVQQIQHQHRGFRIRVKQGKEVALLQVFTDRMVIGEIPVVNQGFMHAAERVRSARMPDAALGRIPLMGNPDMGFKVFQLIIAGHQFRKSHDL